MAVFSKTASPRIRAHGKSTPLVLSIRLESPPVMLYGAPSELSGSLVSGLLFLEVSSAAAVSLDSVRLSLTQTVHYSKPFVLPSASVSACSDCLTRRNVLARWDVLTATSSFSPGRHAYPFSHLLPGSLPASAKLGSPQSTLCIRYELEAVAAGSDGRSTRVSIPLDITRSTLRGPDRNSLRVFPPTEVTASAVLPSVVYPKLQFPIELKLDNVVSPKGDRRWRMRRLNWRLDENTQVRAAVCSKHQSKLSHCEESQRRIRGRSPPKSSANTHHSTIHTGMVLVAEDESQQADTPDPTEREVDTPETDTTEAERSRPIHVHATFVEDFLRPVVPGSSQGNASGAGGSAGSNDSPGVSANSTLDTSTTTTAAATSPQDAANAAHPASTSSAKRLFLEETRTVAHGEIKNGWKSEFSGRGRIELVADISFINFLTGVHNHVSTASSDDHLRVEDPLGPLKGANVSCDISDPELGVYVSHTLIVELVVAEELVGERRKRTAGLEPVASNASTASGNTLSPYASAASMLPSLPAHAPGVPTGAARVLRMQFKLPLVERSGLGIAWDDEVPPTYEDVRSLSPPHYTESPRSISLVLQTPTVINGVGLNTLEPRTSRGIGLSTEIQDLTL